MELSSLLAECSEQAAEGYLADATERIVFGLRAAKRAGSRGFWQNCVRQVRASSFFSLFSAGLVTQRSLAKPRGFSGDAVMIDYLYGIHPTPPPPHDPRVYALEFASAAAHAVRARRDYLADLIRQLTENVGSPAVLSVGSGHARELRRALAQGTSGVTRLKAVLVDSDPVALQTARADTVGLDIRCICERIGPRAVNKGGGTYDLIYSAGLFDYLPQRSAARLTKFLAQLLNPGGRLVVANFTPTLPEGAAMEALMDWRLLFRTPEDMQALCPATDGYSPFNCSLHVDSNHIAWLTVSRR